MTGFTSAGLYIPVLPLYPIVIPIVMSGMTGEAGIIPAGILNTLEQ